MSRVPCDLRAARAQKRHNRRSSMADGTADATDTTMAKAVHSAVLDAVIAKITPEAMVAAVDAWGAETMASVTALSALGKVFDEHKDDMTLLLTSDVNIDRFDNFVNKGMLEFCDRNEAYLDEASRGLARSDRDLVVQQ